MIKNYWFGVEPTHLKKKTIISPSRGEIKQQLKPEPDPRNLQQDLLNGPLNLSI